MATTLTMVLAVFGVIFTAMGADDAVKYRHPRLTPATNQRPPLRRQRLPLPPNPIYGEPLAPGMMQIVGERR